MNGDDKRLLGDVLGDTGADEFRESVLDATLRSARRKRVTRRTGAVVVGLLLAALLPWTWHPTSEPPAIVAQRSQPKPSGLVIHSQPLTATVLVRTSAASVEMISPGAQPLVARVQTVPDAPLFERMSDERLLAFLGEHPAALVRRGARAELVFVNPRDADGFPVQ
ncbi:MAG: hypothetical protein AB1705_16055 [Verrucomicrobiota bacterium]